MRIIMGWGRMGEDGGGRRSQQHWGRLPPASKLPQHAPSEPWLIELTGSRSTRGERTLEGAGGTGRTPEGTRSCPVAIGLFQRGFRPHRDNVNACQGVLYTHVYFHQLWLGREWKFSIMDVPWSTVQSAQVLLVSTSVPQSSCTSQLTPSIEREGGWERAQNHQ